MKKHAPSPPTGNKILVIGIGNEFRGDDSVGLIIADKLEEKSRGSFEIRRESGEGAGLLETWRGYDKVIVIDATHSNSRVGKIHRFDIEDIELPERIFGSYTTHAFGLAEAIKMGKALLTLPPALIIFGIEGKSYAMGSKLSTEVETAIDQAVKAVLEEING